MFRMKRAAEVIPCALGAWLIFIPKTVMNDRQNGLAAVIFGLAFALILTRLPDIMRTKTKIFYVPLFFESIFAGGMFLRIFSEMTARVLLPEYKIWAIAAAMTAAVIYGESMGKKAKTRLAVLSAPVLLAGMVLCLVPAANDMDIKNVDLIPVYAFNVLENGIYAGLLMGFPILAADMEKKAETAGYLLLTGMFAVSAAFIWLSRFNYITDQPVLDLMYAGKSASSFIRRQEGLILCIITVSAYFLLSGLTGCAARSLGSGRARSHAGFVGAGLIFLLSLLPENVQTAEILFKTSVAAGGVYFLIILPAVEVLLYLYGRKKTV